MELEVGSIVEGKVTGITNFGAFIELPEGKTGLVHISEVAREYVNDIREHLKQNQMVKVKVLSIENGGKISLSIKRVLEEEAKQSRKRFVGKPIEVDWSQNRNTQDLSFEDKMLRFKQDSDEKMQAMKRNSEGRRSGYRRSSNSY